MLAYGRPGLARSDGAGADWSTAVSPPDGLWGLGYPERKSLVEMFLAAKHILDSSLGLPTSLFTFIFETEPAEELPVVLKRREPRKA